MKGRRGFSLCGACLLVLLGRVPPTTAQPAGGQRAASDIVVAIVDDSTSMSCRDRSGPAADPAGSAAFAAYQLARFVPQGTRFVVYTFASILSGKDLDGNANPDGWLHAFTASDDSGRGAQADELRDRLQRNGTLSPDAAPGAAAPHAYRVNQTPCAQALTGVAAGIRTMLAEAHAERVSVIFFTDGECFPQDTARPAPVDDYVRALQDAARGPAGAAALRLDVVTFQDRRISTELVALAHALGGDQHDVRPGEGGLAVFRIFGSVLDKGQGAHLTWDPAEPGARVPSWTQARAVNLVVVEECPAAGCAAAPPPPLCGREWSLWTWPDVAGPHQLDACPQPWPARFRWLYARIDPAQFQACRGEISAALRAGNRRAIFRADFAPRVELAVRDGRCGQDGPPVTNLPSRREVCLEARLVAGRPGAEATATIDTLREVFGDPAQAAQQPEAFLGGSGYFVDGSPWAGVAPGAGDAVWRADLPVVCCDKVHPTKVVQEVQFRFAANGVRQGSVSRTLCSTDPVCADPCNGVDDDGNTVVDDGWPDTDGDGTKDCLDADDDGDGCDDPVDPDPLEAPAAGAAQQCLPTSPHWEPLADPGRAPRCTRDASGRWTIDFGEIDILQTDTAVAECLVDQDRVNLRIPAEADPTGFRSPAVNVEKTDVDADATTGDNACFALEYRPVPLAMGTGLVTLRFTLRAKPTCGPLAPALRTHRFQRTITLRLAGAPGAPAASWPGGAVPPEYSFEVRGRYLTRLDFTAVTKGVRLARGDDAGAVRLEYRIDTRAGADPTIVLQDGLELGDLIDPLAAYLPESDAPPWKRVRWSDCEGGRLQPDAPVRLKRPLQRLCIDVPDVDRCRETGLFKGCFGLSRSGKLRVALRDLAVGDEPHALHENGMLKHVRAPEVPVDVSCSFVDWLLWPGWTWLPILFALCVIVGFVRSPWYTFGRQQVAWKAVLVADAEGKFSDPPAALAKEIVVPLKKPPALYAERVGRRVLLPLCFRPRRDRFRLHPPTIDQYVIEVRREGGRTQVVPSCPVYERLDPAKKAYAEGKWSRPAAEPQVVGANSPVYVWVARKVPPGAVLFKVEARE